MKITVISITIFLFLVSCNNNDNVTIDRAEYNKLKGISIVTPKEFSIDRPTKYVDKTTYRISTGSDNHEYYYFDTYGRGPHWFHYPECFLCVKRNTDLMNAILKLNSDIIEK